MRIPSRTLLAAALCAGCISAAPAFSAEAEARKGHVTAIGEVISTHTVQLDSGVAHKLAKIRAKRGEVVVDLGVPNAHPAQAIREGDRVVVSGKAARIDGRPVVSARYIGQLHDVGAAGAADSAEGAMRATKLLGTAVVNGAGASLGRIEGVLLDTRARGQHFALLERAEGGANKRFVYPVNALRRGDTDAMVLHVPERNLELSQGTQDGAWPSPEARSGERYVRVRELIGNPVFDELGNRVGVMHDLEVSLDTARTRAVLVDFAEGGILPLPAHAVHLSPEGRITLQPDSQRRS